MSEKTTVFTTKVGRTAWSFQYDWGRPRASQSLREDAEREAAIPGVQADAIALRSDPSHAQFGLGFLEANDRSRGMVAAIAFAHEQAKLNVQLAIGLFELVGRLWLVALDNDLISVDLLYQDPDEAFSAFAALLPKRQWAKIYLPIETLSASRTRASAAHKAAEAPLAFDAALEDRSAAITTAPLVDLFRDAKAPPHRQRKIRRTDMRAVAYSRPVVFSAATIAALTIGVFGLWPLYKHLTAPKPVVVAEPAPVIAPAPPPPPEINTPSPANFSLPAGQWLKSCFDQMAALDDALPVGWIDGRIECQGTNATLAVKRDTGSIADLDAAYRGLIVTYGPTYDDAMITKATIVPIAPRQAELTASEPLRRRLFSLGWAVHEEIKVDPLSPPPGRQPADKATWRQGALTIKTATDLGQWAQLLDQVPGLVITSAAADAHLMKTAPTQFQWEIKGMAYGL
ncbi:MAG TPA: hypothetical protein VGU69_10440 [Rhizomicrobium sp.]|nr:hypothetical protein [Rhizomicrobium sp.]